MKKFLQIYLYGTAVIFAGIFLLNSENNSFQMIKLTTGISMILGATLALLASISSQNRQVQFNYHFMHSALMLVYGICVLFACNTLEKLNLATSFLLIFYSVSEITFCSWLFNLRQKVIFKILAIRLILGLTVGIGTVFALNFATITLEIFGAMFVLIGANIMLYVPIMKQKESREINYTSK